MNIAPKSKVVQHFGKMAGLILKRKAVAVIVLLDSLEEDEGRDWKRGKARKWIKRRDELGHFNTIVQELRMEDLPAYKEMMRMDL